MTAPLLAQEYRDHAHGRRTGVVRLTYEDRFLRRKVLLLEAGGSLLVDLPQTTSLEHGGVLVLSEGGEIEVVAAPEPLLEVKGAALHRLAWHIGNRHTPCQIETDRLLIQRDHVLQHMLAGLGAVMREIQAPFTPEGGAYGHGRTHGHDHTAQHGPAQSHHHGAAHEH
ncbi:MAG: urease accessory protein UreE [Pseudomonadota bacterium]